MSELLDKDLRYVVKTMSLRNLELLTYEIRDFLISSVSGTGGHLASNLGVVELTVALHHVFDIDRDKIVWDTGHQVYVHKVLTGRAKDFSSLRQFGGISGFPKTGEDVSDVYNSGHSSASVSAAMGLAEARDINGDDYNIIAVIGDGALTGGLAYEGLNNAGNRQTRMIVILNDNETSIPANTGNVAQYLSKLRASQRYQSAKHAIKERMAKIPRVGESMVQGAGRMKSLMRYAVVPGTLFDELGFKYYGPVDGHNLGELIGLFKEVKLLDGPVIIHTVTKKGKGYLNAEKNPGRFHGVEPFDPETGSPALAQGKQWPEYAGEAMMCLAERDRRVVCVSAGMTGPSGLSCFEKSYYRHFFDTGSAEGHAATFAAGLALGGFRPFVFVNSAFLQRAYDEILLDVCAQGLPVVFMVDRAGNVGGDGETHHGVFDLSYLRHIPGLTVMAPKDAEELVAMTGFALSLDRPAAIRYPGGEAPALSASIAGAGFAGAISEGAGFAGAISEGAGFAEAARTGFAEAALAGASSIRAGVSKRICGRSGVKVEFFALGRMVSVAQEAVSILKKEGVSAGATNARFASPIDEKAVLKAAERGALIVTLEDNVVKGGFGEGVCAILAGSGFSTPVLTIGWPDVFVPHGGIEELMKHYGLDAKSVAAKALEAYAAL